MKRNFVILETLETVNGKNRVIPVARLTHDEYCEYEETGDCWTWMDDITALCEDADFFAD